MSLVNLHFWNQSKEVSSGCLYLQDIGQYVYCNCLLKRLKVTSYILKVVFQAVFSAWSKNQDKNLDILKTKKAFKIKQKVLFFLIFKGLSLKPKKNFFGRWESDFNIELLLNTFTLLPSKLFSGCSISFA